MSMLTRLHPLERQLACQRAQIIVEPIAEAFAETWQQALDDDDPLPDELDLVRAAVAQGVPVLAPISVFSYLRQCEKDRRVLDIDRLIETIVHGFAEIRQRDHNCSRVSRLPARSHPG